MKKIAYWLSLSALLFSISSYAELASEEVSYVLDRSSSRTTWLLTNGEAKATIGERQIDERLGPSYLVTIDYAFDIMLYGQKSGSLNLLVPEKMFSDQFYQDLKDNHPLDMGTFTIDFEGMSPAIDNANNTYEECFMTKIYNIDQSYFPPKRPLKGISVKNLEIKSKVHNSVPVIGAVQIDISGEIAGIGFKAGFDLAP